MPSSSQVVSINDESQSSCRSRHIHTSTTTEEQILLFLSRRRGQQKGSRILLIDCCCHPYWELMFLIMIIHTCCSIAYEYIRLLFLLHHSSFGYGPCSIRSIYVATISSNANTGGGMMMMDLGLIRLCLLRKSSRSFSRSSSSSITQILLLLIRYGWTQ